MPRRMDAGGILEAYLHQFEGPEVVEVHDAENSFGFVDDDDGSDLALLHQIEGFAGENVRADGLWVMRHSVAGCHVESGAAMLFHQAAQITVGDDAGEAAVGMKHGGHAQALVTHFVNDGGHERFGRHMRQRAARVHFVLDAHELAAETTSGMKGGEVVVAKVASLEKRDGEGIAYGHRDGGASGGSKIQRAGFFADTNVEGDVTGFGEGGGNLAGEGDQRNLEALEGFEKADDLFGFAAVRDGEHSVTTREHSEITVQGFGGMQKEGRGAGAGKSGGNFSSDKAGLAHARDDDAAFASKEQVDGAVESGVQASEDVLDGLGFDLKDVARGWEAHGSVIRDK
jgi:hypothetical protein